LSEGIVHEEDFLSSHSVLVSHVGDKLSLVSGPCGDVSVRDLSKELAGVGVVEAVPGVVVLEHESSLGFVKKDGGSAISFVSLGYIVSILRGLRKGRDHEFTPFGHSHGSLSEVFVGNCGVESDSTGSPLLESKVSGSAVGGNNITINASVFSDNLLVYGGKSRCERVSVINVK
jgi:hypothetical protein